MDPAFLRPGRFGKHLYVGYPSANQRAQIVNAIIRKKPIDPDVNLDALARSEACENFSGADLSALVCCQPLLHTPDNSHHIRKCLFSHLFVSSAGT